MDEIEPSVETLFRQAPMTANHYFSEALDIVKRRVGTEDPVLVAAVMQAAALDFQAGYIGSQIKQLAYQVELLRDTLRDELSLMNR